MSKKGKKNRKLKKLYNRKQFENVLCTGCRVCSGYATGPDFCYELYKEDPEAFLDGSYKKLTAIEDWPWTVKTEVDVSMMASRNTPIHDDVNIQLVEKSVFRNIYCRSGVCVTSDPGNCPMFDECLLNFRKQTGNWGDSPVITGACFPGGKAKSNKKQAKRERKRAAKKNRGKAKYICKAYPTFFTNDREGWKEQIEEILTNGDKNSKQDTGTGSS